MTSSSSLIPEVFLSLFTFLFLFLFLVIVLPFFVGGFEVVLIFELHVGAGANGKTGKEWKKLLPYLRSRLSTDWNVSLLCLKLNMIVVLKKIE